MKKTLKVDQINDSWLIRYFELLSPLERIDMKSFVQSPWVYRTLKNPNYNIEQTLLLFDFINGLQNLEDQIHEYKVFNAVFGRTYQKSNISQKDKRRLNNCKTVLTKLLEQYLKFKTLLNDAATGNSCLAEAVYRRISHNPQKLEKLYTRIIRNFEKVCEKNSTSAIKLYYTKLLEQTRYYYKLVIHNRENHIQPTSYLRALSRDYLLQFIQTICAIKNKELVNNVPKFIFPYHKIIEEFRKAEPFDETPLVGIYSSLLLLLDGTGTYETFRKCHDFLLENDDIATYERRQIFGFLSSYMNRTILNGNIDLQQRRLALYNFVLEENIITPSTPNFHYYFLMMIRYASQESLYPTHATQLLNNYGKVFLSDSQRFLAEAHESFARNCFAEAKDKLTIQLLDDIRSDILYEYYFQILLIKVNYELDDPLLQTQIHAFRAKLTNYLKKDNSTLSNELNEGYKNFTLRMESLLIQKRKPSPRKMILDRIIRQIKENPTEESNWLLQKIATIQKLLE